MTSQALSKRNLGEDGDSGNSTVLCLAVLPKKAFKSFPLYWLKLPVEAKRETTRLVAALCDVLVDPLQEELLWCQPEQRETWLSRFSNLGFKWWAERQFLPGVTDNLAHTVQEALELKGLSGIAVASGSGHLFEQGTIKAEMSGESNRTKWKEPPDALEYIAHTNRYLTYHPLTDRFVVHDLAIRDVNRLLSFPAVHLPQPAQAAEVDLALSDGELERLSRDSLWALNLSEMQAIRAHFEKDTVKETRKARGLSSLPTDVELEILAQTWSEHCKHKIFNATISHTFEDEDGKRSETIKSLYKTYIQAPTRELMEHRDDLLSVFEDNSGVVKWNDKWAVCFKVETHNSPSALEPYGGALTGILGVNRDILGTGLGAKPLFNTDVFCFAYPEEGLADRPKLLPARAILNGVRKGVQDGGNKSGIPTVNGAIFFDAGYRAKPLVFCGTGGILPLTVGGKTGYEKHTQSGDRIIMAGGKVGKDGVHGATFSSETMHEGSPVSAVQIGDPFTQKRLSDFVIEARDQGLITGITDNGAGGLSSSVGEMARLTGGASMELENIPRKYPGLADWEVVVSESQERMTLASRSFYKLKMLADKHHVEITDIGYFHDRGYFEITNSGKPVALLDLDFLHDGLPQMSLVAEGSYSPVTTSTAPMPQDLKNVLLKLLSHPNIASREQVIHQYDHEVQGMSVIKPLMGKRQLAACDAAVICPVYTGAAGLVIANGLSPRLSQYDAYLMAVCAVDEAIRNAVCVGCDPDTISLLDNFCWPDPIYTDKNPDGKIQLSRLVRACQGLNDAVKAFETPLISGKDSMKNDFDDGVVRLSIPPTLLISAMGRINNIDDCVSMEFKHAGDAIYLLSAGRLGLASSHYAALCGWQSSILPYLDLATAAEMYRILHFAMRTSLVASAHDLSEGGLAVCLSECMIGSGLGCEIDAQSVSQLGHKGHQMVVNTVKLLARIDIALFAEGPGRLVVSVPGDRSAQFEDLWRDFDCRKIGTVTKAPKLVVRQMRSDLSEAHTFVNVDVSELERAWRNPLPFD